jgi:hypothetical protein
MHGAVCPEYVLIPQHSKGEGSGEWAHLLYHCRPSPLHDRDSHHLLCHHTPPPSALAYTPTTNSDSVWPAYGTQAREPQPSPPCHGRLPPQGTQSRRMRHEHKGRRGSEPTPAIGTTSTARAHETTKAGQLNHSRFCAPTIHFPTGAAARASPQLTKVLRALHSPPPFHYGGQQDVWGQAHVSPPPPPLQQSGSRGVLGNGNWQVSGRKLGTVRLERTLIPGMGSSADANNDMCPSICSLIFQFKTFRGNCGFNHNRKAISVNDQSILRAPASYEFRSYDFDPASAIHCECW